MFFDEPKPHAYQSGVVTFLDILGFSEIVRDRSATEIGSMLDAITETAAPNDAWGESAEVLTFSDSIVRSHSYTSGVFRAALSEICELAYAQFDLARGGILIRGGMTAGEVYVSESRIFGPAFVRAYELESSFARAPRIVIDAVLIKEIRRQRTTADLQFMEEIRSLRQWITQGDDGLWFVDYLRSHYMPEAPLSHAFLMKSHRDMIIDRARDLDPISSLVPKYLWLARYHNGVAAKMHPESDHIRIRRRDIPIFDELLLPKRARGSKTEIVRASPTSAKCK